MGEMENKKIYRERESPSYTCKLNISEERVKEEKLGEVMETH